MLLQTVDQNEEIVQPDAVKIPANFSGDFSSVSSRVRKLCESGGFQPYTGKVLADCAGLEVPCDEETGLPLPTIIGDYPQTRKKDFVDFHHQFFPKNLLKKTDDQLAVRVSRGQDMPRGLHERHHQFFGGPQLPQTREQAFRACVLACAGVVPRQAIDLRRSPVIREATDEEYRVIVASTHLEAAHRRNGGQQQRDRIGTFFANYALEQSIQDVVSDKHIDEFLSTPYEGRRKELANLMLTAAVDMSVDPIVPLYSDLREEGLIAGKVYNPDKVVKHYFMQGHLNRFRRGLHRVLEPLAS